jgi:hypothetical protein
MNFTHATYLTKTKLRVILLLATWALFFTHAANADTVVSSANGGMNLCINGGYVTLGDITVKEGHIKDFEKDKTNQTFTLTVPSTNFEFRPGYGSVQLASGINSIANRNYN